MASILEILLRAKGGEQVKGELGKVKKSTDQTSKAFAAMGAMLSVGLLAKGIKSSLAAYKIQELAVTKLNAALKVQGVFTEGLSQSFQKQASALQALTIFGDEAILSGQAFTMSMGLSADTVQKITPIVLDFASAMGLDLQTAFRVVGQAGAGEIGMLKRYGIIVDEDKLKTEGFNAVIDQMKKSFEGTAEAVAKSGIGPMEQFKNLMGDFMEDIGRTIIPTINWMIKTFMRLGGELQNKAIDKHISLQKQAKKAIDEGNLSLAERNHLVNVLASGNEAWLESVMGGFEKEKEINEKKIEMSETWKKRIEEGREKEEDLRNKAIENESKEIEDRYNFRRELRELDLEEIMESLEKRLEEVSGNKEKEQALFMALQNFKKEARVQEAVEIAEWNDKVSELFANGVKDWKSAWAGFQDYVVNFALKNIADELVRTIGLGKALKAVLGGVTGGGILGGIGSLLGFQHGGTVPGPIGQPRAVIAHGGEKFTPPGRVGNETSGQGLQIIFHISGNLIEGDKTKWDRLIRNDIYPPLQRLLRKTGEQFSGS